MSLFGPRCSVDACEATARYQYLRGWAGLDVRVYLCLAHRAYLIGRETISG